MSLLPKGLSRMMVWISAWFQMCCRESLSPSLYRVSQHTQTYGLWSPMGSERPFPLRAAEVRTRHVRGQRTWKEISSVLVRKEHLFSILRGWGMLMAQLNELLLTSSHTKLDIFLTDTTCLNFKDSDLAATTTLDFGWDHKIWGLIFIVTPLIVNFMSQPD